MFENEGEEKMQHFTFQNLVDAAAQEDWDTVDSKISQFSDDPTALNWAFRDGLSSEDGNVRDLAASLIEKSSHNPSEEEIGSLISTMNNDSNPYAQFRSAFALFAHGNRSDQVTNKLREALEDEDVKDIAQNYLSHLEQ